MRGVCEFGRTLEGTDVLDPSLRQTIAQHVSGGMQEQRDRFKVALLAFLSRAPVGNSRVGLQLVAMHVEEFRVRMKLVWTSIERVLRSRLPDSYPGLADDLRAVVGDYLTQHAGELLVSIASRRGIRLEVPNQLEAEQHALRDRYSAEAEILAGHLSQPRSPTHVTIHGPVGAVQTGAGSVANVTQTIAGQDQETIRSALAGLAEAIGGAKEVEPDSRDAMLAIIPEIEAEVVKDRPNRLRISGLASGIGQTIQTVAALQGAWTMLKLALSAIGIPGF